MLVCLSGEDAAQDCLFYCRTTGEFEAGHAPGAINVPVLNASPDGDYGSSYCTAVLFVDSWCQDQLPLMQA